MAVPRSVVAIVLASALTLALSACGGSTNATDDGDPKKVTIAVGSGIAYAPLTVMKAEGMLEERFPDTEFVWNEGVSGGAATRDGMLADDIQVGVAGIAPFLIGVDKGVDWKVLGSMGQIGIDLVARDPKIKTLQDLDDSGKAISLPSPDSGQAIALKAMGEKELGDIKAFDDQFAAMAHPDAFQALIGGTTGAAFTGPPFSYQLIDEHGAHKLATAADVFGPMTYSSIVLTQKFHDEFPEFAEGLYEALTEALDMIDNRPEQAGAILSKAEEGATDPEQYAQWLQRPENDWSVIPQGYMNNAKFMESIGLISEVPDGVGSLMFDTVRGEAK